MRMTIVKNYEGNAKKYVYQLEFCNSLKIMNANKKIAKSKIKYKLRYWKFERTKKFIDIMK